MRRLFVVYGAALTSAVLIALLVPLGMLAKTLANDRAMAAARHDVQLLTAAAATGNATDVGDAIRQLERGSWRTTIYLPDGEVIGRGTWTRNVELASTGMAFTANTKGGKEILQPVTGSNGTTTVIRTFVPNSALNAGVTATWATLAGVGAFLLAAAVVAGAFIARRLSRSVTELSGVAKRVGAGDLTATVQPSGPPEVESVGRVLNGLGARITQMLKQERELSADLSHRLRTPVTALRLDVESLRNPGERARMAGHVDALAAAVDAAVSAARSPGRPHPCPQCDAAEVVAGRAQFWSVLAEETHRPFTVSTPEKPIPVGLPEDLLGAALDALLDNVFSHTPGGTPFAMSVTPNHDGEVDVVVEDDGPGMLDPDLAKPGRSSAGSTGIGLDVARRTAEQAGGRVGVRRSATGGARIVMTMPMVLSEP